MSASARPTASIVIPTRSRPQYLDVALASIAPQATSAGAEVIVVDDAGSSVALRTLVERHGARYEPMPIPTGLNAARNAGLELAAGELIVFVDDDVAVAPGWLPALLDGARRYPQAEIFTGPIRPRLEGRPPRGCGREALVTALDLGPRDSECVRCAWGANMTIRRRAFERVGPFDVSIEHGGDEQEWQERLLADARENGRVAEGLIVYIADAAVDHRRSPADARLRALARTAYRRGRAARRLNARGGCAPARRRELATLLACLGHVARRRCPAGLVAAAHSFGRLREGMNERRA